MNETICACLNCGATEEQIPLVALRYKTKPSWVCSRCMPVLIHKPAELVGKLEDADKVPPG